MPRETVTISISDQYSYESAAMLFAVLAYPDDKRTRDRFADAVCNVMLRQFATDPTWANELQNTRPRHWLIGAEKADQEWQQGMLILNEERFMAAKMAAPKWAGFVRQETGVIHPGLKVVGPTSNEMLTTISIELDERRGTETDFNKGNIVSRQWSTSKPVLHLCLGMHKVIHDTAADHLTFNPWDFFFDRNLTAAVIDKAAAVFQAAKQVFNIDPDQMVEVIAV
jgi:hypothetical protein